MSNISTTQKRTGNVPLLLLSLADHLSCHISLDESFWSYAKGNIYSLLTRTQPVFNAFGEISCYLRIC